MFPSLKRPLDYADVLIEASRLKAFDGASARARGKFRRIKLHAFAQCHKSLGLLRQIRDANNMAVPVSERDPAIFRFQRAQAVLDIEKGLLMHHAESNDGIRRLCALALRMDARSTISQIRSRINEGNLFKQAGSYERAYCRIKGSGIRMAGYLFFGIRSVPVPKYYLTQKAKRLLVRYASQGVIR